MHHTCRLCLANPPCPPVPLLPPSAGQGPRAAGAGHAHLRHRHPHLHQVRGSLRQWKRLLAGAALPALAACSSCASGSTLCLVLLRSAPHTSCCLPCHLALLHSPIPLFHQPRRGGRWREDEGYTAQLGRGWQLEGVREACYKALATVGKDAMHFRCGQAGGVAPAAQGWQLALHSLGTALLGRPLSCNVLVRAAPPCHPRQLPPLHTTPHAGRPTR